MNLERRKDNIAKCINDNWGKAITGLTEGYDHSLSSAEHYNMCRASKILIFNLFTTYLLVVGGTSTAIVALAQRRLKVIPFAVTVFILVAPILMLRYCVGLASDRSTTSIIGRGLDTGETLVKQGTAKTLRAVSWLTNTRLVRRGLNVCKLENPSEALDETAENIENREQIDETGGRPCYLGLFKTLPATFRN